MKFVLKIDLSHIHTRQQLQRKYPKCISMIPKFWYMTLILVEIGFEPKSVNASGLITFLFQW